MRALFIVLLAAFAGGCGLLLDDPAPFQEARKDAAVIDMAPTLPDFAMEDAFVLRPRDFSVDAEPVDAGPADAAPCPDAGDADCPDALP